MVDFAKLPDVPVTVIVTVPVVAMLLAVNVSVLVLVALLGLNDALPSGARPATSPAEYRSHLLALVDRVLSLGARPVLVAPRRKC